MLRALTAGLLACGALLAQGTPPKEKASAYPVHFQTGDAEFGAEFLVRTLSYENRSITSDDYLIVEVAVFPSPGREVPVSSHHFTLRLNGKKQVLHAQTPGIVAASFKYPDWEYGREITVGASDGERGVILGRRPQVGRFPDDQRPAQSRIPGRVPRVPTQPDGQPQPEAIDAPEMVNRGALPEGPMTKPVSGYVCFAWKGKLKSIKTVELIRTDSSGGTVSARLR